MRTRRKTLVTLVRCGLWVAVALAGMRAVHLISRGAEAADASPPTASSSELGFAVTHALVPYTVVLAEVVSAGRHGVVVTKALRSDGAFVMRTDYLPPNQAAVKVSQRLIHFPNGIRIDADDLRELAFAVQLKGWTASDQERNPARECRATYTGARMFGDLRSGETIAGLRTLMVARDDVTKWFAIDYGCAEVRMVRRDVAIPDQEVVRVFSGEPDASLFEISATYHEASPSVLYRMSAGGQRATSYDTWYEKAKVSLDSLVTDERSR
jgi:hypothetical protein